MLIELKMENPLVGNRIFGFPIWFEQVLQMLLDEQRAAQDAHYLIDVRFEFHLTFKYCHHAISANGSIDLYPDGSLRVSPESGDTEMLLYPFEEQLDLPAMLVKKHCLFCREIEIVGIECVRTLLLGYIGNDSAYLCRIVFSVTPRGESNRLIPDNITFFKQILTGYNLIFRIPLFPQNKERVVLFNLKQSCQVPVTAIEDITCQRLIINHIHGVNVMDCGLGNMNHGRYVSGDVKLGVKFDSGLSTSESCPVEHRQAQVYGGGVKSIELPADAELSVDTCALCKLDHVVGKCLEHMPVPMVVTTGKGYLADRLLPKAQMEGFLFMGAKYYCQLAQTPATEKLAEYQNKELAPVGQLPPQCSVVDIIFGSFLHYPFKFTLRQKFYNLTEYVLSAVHGCYFTPIFRAEVKIAISKVRQHFQPIKFSIYLYIML